MTEPLLAIDDLNVRFRTEDGPVYALNGVDITIEHNEVMGIIGESGCGKSVTALSVLQLLQSPPAEIIGGEIRYKGENLLERSDSEMDEIRGNEISMIYQDPMKALNPVLTIGQQVTEPLLAHRDVTKDEAIDEAIEMLRACGLADAERLVDEYPHSLSGGMRQRVMIAMGLITKPDLLIADEPTTALDVTTQAKILDLLEDISDEFDMSIMYISHNLATVSEVADRITVMYAGTVAERCTMNELFERPLHPYTRKLIESIPKLDTVHERLPAIEGSVPTFNEPPSGCPFASRCPQYIGSACDEVVPQAQPPGEAYDVEAEHTVACHLYTDASSEKPPWTTEEHTHDSAY
ncbi:ABC transporter ATP-binding protein [Natrialba sp. INN-245]|uniref:ABC transporter ATP-binding protein n=1 Tax=Natrialba sp. INN-245 TaxID=2690967 RepID=UPI0013125977|nr:ABC transporter ATP-binding protein [Natrialba sp. INN-245]MWV41967.1 ATP-binding cassette domain-containing protein [Natrialba sp. INN-245]